MISQDEPGVATEVAQDVAVFGKVASSRGGCRRRRANSERACYCWLRRVYRRKWHGPAAEQALQFAYPSFQVTDTARADDIFVSLVGLRSRDGL
jgi:hypothetical protein